jgi:endonuclease YncB( thermonuclease family)
LGQNQGVRSAHAIDAIDGHSVKLDDETLVLAGIAVPLPGDGAYAQRWAEQARRKLHDLVAGRTLTLVPVDPGHDRYWRLVAQASDDKGVWLQGELLRAGLARVWVPSSTADRLEEMLKLEREARLGKRGMWSDTFFAALDADSIDRHHLDRLQLVEGRVKAVATVRGTTYLNFGDDWRRDFTVEIDAQTRRAFVKVGIDPASLKDRKLRVRGWPTWRNGPAIDVKYVSQIELLE